LNGQYILVVPDSGFFGGRSDELREVLERDETLSWDRYSALRDGFAGVHMLASQRGVKANHVEQLAVRFEGQRQDSLTFRHRLALATFRAALARYVGRSEETGQTDRHDGTSNYALS
jgi:hypothetical protein